MTTKHTPGPVTGPYHGPSISDQLRLIGSLCGTNHPTGKAEQRAAVAYVSVVVADLLDAATAFLQELDAGTDFPAWEAAKAKLRTTIAKARGEG